MLHFEFPRWNIVVAVSEVYIYCPRRPLLQPVSVKGEN